MTDSYRYKTPPFPHQREWFEKIRGERAYGVFWEQGTGKSKLTLDIAAWKYLEGQINCLVVIAPNGVHRNWIVNEIPAHLPEEVKHHDLLWISAKAGNKSAKKAAEKALKAKGLLIVAISYHGVMTKAGDAFLQKLLEERACMMVLDESATIKNPKAKWTIRLLARGKRVAQRLILTGTPVSNSPFDVFSQVAFLDPAAWRKIGCRSYTAFKNFFGVWEQAMDPRSGRMYPNLIRYRNLTKLHEIVDAIGTRVTKDDVLDLPPKLYQKRYFDLSPEQRRAYESMKDTWEVALASGEISSAMLVIVQLTRFQQITSGFLVDEDDNLIELGDKQPRLDLLLEVMEETQGKAIIWAKWRHDITRIVKALNAAGIEAVRYDGEVKTDDRNEAIERFQHGSARAFVANPAAAGTGLTLHAARTVIYFNNSFKLTDRLQSEDRAHRIGQEHPVLYIDLVATDTVDERIVDSLQQQARHRLDHYW
jgi:SNF2 family DNA or RNA helicase